MYISFWWEDANIYICFLCENALRKCIWEALDQACFSSGYEQEQKKPAQRFLEEENQCLKILKELLKEYL